MLRSARVDKEEGTSIADRAREGRGGVGKGIHTIHSPRPRKKEVRDTGSCVSRRRAKGKNGSATSAS